jgi:hypothetical protein
MVSSVPPCRQEQNRRPRQPGRLYCRQRPSHDTVTSPRGRARQATACPAFTRTDGAPNSRTFGIRLVNIRLSGPHSLTIAISCGPPRVCAVPFSSSSSRPATIAAAEAPVSPCPPFGSLRDPLSRRTLCTSSSPQFPPAKGHLTETTNPPDRRPGAAADGARSSA